MELLGDKDNHWHGTVRQAPEKCALRGMPFRATPLHSATDRGPGRVDGVWGPRELEVIHVHPVRQWRYSTQIVNASLLVEADNVCPQHLPHTPKSCPRTISKLSSCSFQVRYRRLDSTIPYITTMVKLDDSDNPFVILKHSYIQLQLR